MKIPYINTEAPELVCNNKIACCNWPQQYPYTPDVKFAAVHNGEYLFLKYEVEENCTAAKVMDDNGPVWTDSCVEFFIKVDDNSYYNFEVNCIGSLLLGYRKQGDPALMASPDVLATIKRRSSFVREPIVDNGTVRRWSLQLAIPATALFKHRLKSWNGVKAEGNFYKCGDNLATPHFLSWAPITWEKPNFHLPEFFKELSFD
ncbi:MAG: carbohydrate-binding family 9-like protein [Muribaculum sp.]|nr:carbohydrate-binding family 9-like protein [Muribaculaceae bacterium]MCM1081541.1 carbohydrate-binding family 9-like protein [Muribaculum sp.]